MLDDWPLKRAFLERETFTTENLKRIYFLQLLAFSQCKHCVPVGLHVSRFFSVELTIGNK